LATILALIQEPGTGPGTAPGMMSPLLMSIDLTTLRPSWKTLIRSDARALTLTGSKQIWGALT